MTTILDHVRPISGEDFTPANYNAFFALQLARQLSNVSELPKYLPLFEHYPGVLLAGAARRLRTAGIGAVGFQQFEHELQHGHFQGPGAFPPVVGIRIERRSVGYVILSRGAVLEEDKRELLNSESAALRTVTAFFAERSQQWHNSPVAMLAVEEQDIRRSELARAVRLILRESNLSVWEVSRAQILSSYHIPAATTFQQVRRIAAKLLPELAGTDVNSTIVLDAAIPALYVDVARQLLPEYGGAS